MTVESGVRSPQQLPEEQCENFKGKPGMMPRGFVEENGTMRSTGMGTGKDEKG